MSVELNVNKVTPIRKDTQQEQLSLRLTSEEFIRNEELSSRVVKRYDGKISGHIEQILTENLSTEKELGSWCFDIRFVLRVPCHFVGVRIVILESRIPGLLNQKEPEKVKKGIFGVYSLQHEDESFAQIRSSDIENLFSRSKRENKQNTTVFETILFVSQNQIRFKLNNKQKLST